jgi:D-lactate dehydrogenase
MEVAVFSTKPHDRRFLEAANSDGAHRLSFFEARLSTETAKLASGAHAVSAFVNDDLGTDVITLLAEAGTRLIALRSAGFNHVDLKAADAAGLAVARVPAYSPHAVAEHS